jgi:hypothetical protein
MNTLVFTSATQYVSEEDLKDAYTFGDFTVPKKEYEYLKARYPSVNLPRKLEGLSKWVTKHPDVRRLDLSRLVERRIQIENDEPERQPGFARAMLRRLDF